MVDKTTFTKRDREFIINLAKSIDSLSKRFDSFEKVHNIPKTKPIPEKAVTPSNKMYRGKTTPTVHAEFFKTEDKEKQMQQYIFVESLEQTLREICEKNGIAFLTIEIDTRDQ